MSARRGRQEAWRSEIARLSYNITPVLDRNYFHSIYFRELMRDAG